MMQRFEMAKARHARTLNDAVSSGEIDERMKSLCGFIAGTGNHFTSSVCAGRILLLALPKGEEKREAYFHRRWHRTVQTSEAWKALQEKTRGAVWLKMEPFIVHLGSRNLESARGVLSAMKLGGVKRGGIIVAKEGKFITELQGTESMSVPVKRCGKILITREYLEFLLGIANKKLRKNYARLKRFEKACRKVLS